ncbi:MAG: IPTL-CTERM sorting domain-containing protein [Pseudomonadota bacterium]
MCCASAISYTNATACTVYNGTTIGTPAVYTDCRIFATDRYPVLNHDGGVSIRVVLLQAPNLTPQPTIGDYYGNLAGANELMNVGANISTDCRVIAYANNVPIPAVDGDVYCAEFKGTVGNIYLRGRWNQGLNQFTNIAVWPSTATQIPTLSVWGLILLTGLIGLFGVISRNKKLF